MAVPGKAGHPVATEAVTLFFARAAMAGVTLQAGPGERRLRAKSADRAGGLPLALELIANRLRVASLTELAEGLGLSGWRPGSRVPGGMTRWTRAWPGVMRCCRLMRRWYSGG